MAYKPTPETTFDSGRRVFTNLKYIYFTPWTKSESGEDQIGSTTYDLVNIVGDTTTIEQEDNEINEIAHEFSSEPLYENITLGKYSFTTECIDFRNEVLVNLFGWEVDGNNNVYAPIDYKEKYCAIEMGFNSTDDVVVLPKVKLNSKAVLASMKTDASRATISGTCYSAYVNDKETVIAGIKAQNDGTITYTISASEGGEQTV